MASNQAFGLTSPSEMLAKAERELARLESDPSVDHAWNFVTTVYHVRDYLKANGKDVAWLDSDSDFQLCRLAANTGKHLVLDRRSAPAAAARRFDTHGDVGFSGHEQFAVVADGNRTQDVKKRAAR